MIGLVQKQKKLNQKKYFTFKFVLKQFKNRKTYKYVTSEPNFDAYKLNNA